MTDAQEIIYQSGFELVLNGASPKAPTTPSEVDADNMYWWRGMVAGQLARGNKDD